MNEQLSLFETAQPQMPVYSLILAIFPDPGTAQHLAHLGNTLRQQHEMQGRLRPTSHLHVSLPLPIFRKYTPETMVETIVRVCKAVAAVTHPFQISFQRVMSFRGVPGNRPIVLAGDEHGNNEVKKFHGLLWGEFGKYISLPQPASKFNPHVTLLYDQRELVCQPIEEVHWTVKEIVLVCSEVGATKYHRLGSWSLAA